MKTTKNFKPVKTHLTAIADALKAATCLSNVEIAAYLDGMLQHAPGADGKAYRIGGNLELFDNALCFMDEAVASDLEKLKEEAANFRGQRGIPIWRHLDLLDLYFRRLFSDDFNYCPALKLLFKLLTHKQFQHGPHNVFSKSVLLTGAERVQAQRKAFVDLVTLIQSEAIRLDLADKVVQWQFPANSNALRANDYVAYLFRRNDGVTVIELIVSYPQSAIVNGNDLDKRMILIQGQQLQDHDARLNGKKPKEVDGVMPVIPPDTLKRDLALIFGGVKGKAIFRDKVGHATSMEWSRAGGHYARLMLAFDGALTDEQAIERCDAIGDYIVRRTDGRMVYVNCNHDPAQYPETGLIQAGDAEKRVALLRRLLLWAQKHQFVSIKASGGFRAFTTGDIPKEWKDPDHLRNRVHKPRTVDGKVQAAA
ncbi:hypothetical protein ACXIUT_20880 [Achromobacter denitrificans]